MLATPPTSQVHRLHARHKHGGHPIQSTLPKSPTPFFEIQWPTDQGGPQTYKSARQMLLALYNNGDTSSRARDPGVTLARYFRLKPCKPMIGPTVFEMFAEEIPQPPIVVPPAPRQTLKRRRCPAHAGRWYKKPLAIAFTTLALFGNPVPSEAVQVHDPTEIHFRWADQRPTPEQLSVEAFRLPTKKDQTLSVGPPIPLGIDLAARGHEVRKLLYKGFGARIARRGFDIEDVLQEVYKGLLTRNKGICPFDARKSSFGHYVHMVSGCILSNYERKMGRRAEHEQLGMYDPTASDEGGMVDAALAGSTLSLAPWKGTSRVEDELGTRQAISSLLVSLDLNGRDIQGDLRPEAELAARALPHLYAGCRRGEIALRLGEPPANVGRALSFLREEAGLWAGEEGLR